jgi:hypothetical protein
VQRLKGRKVSLTLTYCVLGEEVPSLFNNINNNNNNNNNLSSFLRMLGPIFRLTLSCHVSSPSPFTRWSFRHSSNRSQNITPALCYNVYFHKLLLSLLACARSDYKQLWGHSCGPTATIMLRNQKVLPPTLFFPKRKRTSSLINVLKGSSLYKYHTARPETVFYFQSSWK